MSDSMKIAITTSGNDLQSPVDQRFGRAKAFLVLDTETGEYEVVDNKQNLNAAQGAGIQSATSVANLGVKAVITGNCGPKAHVTLSAAGIEIFLGAEGTVGEMVEKFKKGELEPAGGPNKEGHWM